MLQFVVNKKRLSTTTKQLSTLLTQVETLNKSKLMNVRSGLMKRLNELRDEKLSLTLKADQGNAKSIDRMTMLTSEESLLVEVLGRIKLFLS